jgi:hypothetical protein
MFKNSGSGLLKNLKIQALAFCWGSAAVLFRFGIFCTELHP